MFGSARMIGIMEPPSEHEPGAETGVIASALPRRAVRWHRVLAVGILSLLGAALLAGLGWWQWERRVWKLALIQQVEGRVHARPHAIPATAAMRPAEHEYEHVEVTGAYLPDRDTWVHASTELGSGYWILSPRRLQNGSLVLINRGFVGMETARNAVPVDSASRVVGLLRVSEPSGWWPRRNDASADRWYSRDVAAIAAARGLSGVLPYFIDAEPLSASGIRAQVAAAGRGDAASVWPVAGLTMVHFRNNHLSYALTWFMLALMTLVAGARALRAELRAR